MHLRLLFSTLWLFALISANVLFFVGERYCYSHFVHGNLITGHIVPERSYVGSSLQRSLALIIEAGLVRRVVGCRYTFVSYLATCGAIEQIGYVHLVKVQIPTKTIECASRTSSEAAVAVFLLPKMVAYLIPKGISCLFCVLDPILCSPFLDRFQANMSNISSAFILNFRSINNDTKVSADLVCYWCTTMSVSWIFVAVKPRQLHLE